MLKYVLVFGPVAQSVEHLPFKQSVRVRAPAGSQIRDLSGAARAAPRVFLE